jgi:hypothetical protein
MKRPLVTFLLVAALSGVYAWLLPGSAVRPGRLLAAHDSLEHHCLACHAPGRGVPTGKCTACHGLGDIGLLSVAGQPLQGQRSSVQGLHQRFAEESCTGCHREHTGRLENRVAAGFTHDRMPRELQRDCAVCHQSDTPGDDLHRALGTTCNSCHRVEGWLPATFDHALLSAGVATCLSCHRQDRPLDELHRDLDPAGECSSCHQTSAWTPANFEHEKFFRFDRHHPDHCADCHTPGRGYQHYDCMGCHAHSPAEIEAEHREEGIRDFQECVECHRSGNEDEIIGRRGRAGNSEHGERDDD